MWEAIRSNKRRSWMLIIVLGLILAGAGFAMGGAFEPNNGPLIGLAVAIGLWLMLWVMGSQGGTSLLMATAGARQIEKADAPQLFNVVEEMTIASGLPAMPKVYIIDDPRPNAFATGRKPDQGAVAVTSGLLRRLNRDELQGVVAHEIAHIHNMDVRFMTLASVMLGAIVMLSDVFVRAMFWGSVGRRRSANRQGGGQAIFMAVALAFAILGPIFAQLLYFACSRKREYLADACSARFTRYPEGLASALKKIARGNPGGESAKKTSRAMAALYIVNPLQGAHQTGWGSTHPPVKKRIEVLEAMSGGAGFAAYEEAFERVNGGDQALDARTLSGADAVEIREPSVKEEDKSDAIGRARAALDLVDGMAGLAMVPCACGARLKIPPAYDRPTVACPRCKRTHDVPAASEAGGGSEGGGEAKKLRFKYKRKNSGWESFRCRCGRSIELSPKFSAGSIDCRECGAEITIES